MWKVELQKLADETDLEIGVCHLPPGTSKWNKWVPETAPASVIRVIYENGGTPSQAREGLSSRMAAP